MRTTSYNIVPQVNGDKCSLDDSSSIDKHPMPLRGQQLAFRHEEVYITYSTFIRFIQGDPTLQFDTIDSSSYDRQSWTASNEGLPLVKYDSDVSLTGHSFGGCTVVSPNAKRLPA